MKMTGEHYNQLKTLIDNKLATVNVDALLMEYSTLTRRRMVWDILWSARLPGDFVDELYTYLNDDNITTALNRICPK